MFINYSDNFKNYFQEQNTDKQPQNNQQNLKNLKPVTSFRGKIKSLDYRNNNNLKDKSDHIRYRYQRCVNEQMVDRNGHNLQFNTKSLQFLYKKPLQKKHPNVVKNFIFDPQQHQQSQYQQQQQQNSKQNNNYYIQKSHSKQNLNLPKVYFHSPDLSRTKQHYFIDQQQIQQQEEIKQNSKKRSSENLHPINNNGMEFSNNSSRKNKTDHQENINFGRTQYQTQQQQQQYFQKKPLENLLEEQKKLLQQKKQKIIQFNTTQNNISQMQSQNQSFLNTTTYQSNHIRLSPLDNSQLYFNKKLEDFESQDKYQQLSLKKKAMPKLTGNAYKIKEQNIFLIEEGETNLNQLIKKNKSNKTKKLAYKQVSQSTKNLNSYFREINQIKKEVAERIQKHQVQQQQK